jgi:hypothetical protein
MLKINNLVRKAVFLCVFAGCLLTACNQDRTEAVKPQKPKEATAEKSGSRLTDQQRLDRLKQIAFMLTELIKTNIIKQEVADGVNSKYYADETVYLKDLLEPATSNIYRGKENLMLFDNNFRPVFDTRAYMNASQFSAVTWTDLKSFIDEDRVGIYFPYSENWDTRKLPTITWNTIEERNDNIGYEPIVNTNGVIMGFRQVTVDDAYAEANPVWIVKHYYTANKIIEDGEYGDGGGGIGGGGPLHDEILPDCNAFLDPSKIYHVSLGHIKVTKQLDPLLGFNNSGGAEMVMVRAKGFLSASNPQPTITDATTHLPKITRKQIRKKEWVGMFRDFDTNWQPNETQHVIGLYEDDNTGSKTLSGTVKIATPITYVPEFSLGFSQTIVSENDPEYNMDWLRCDYFRKAKASNPYHGSYNGWYVFAAANTYFTLPYIID